jgi:hypothetical protein
MKSQNVKKTRSIRRKKSDLNENLLSAAKAEIIEHGFENATITNIVKRAKIQANVFYNRYDNIHGLFDKLIRPYDYWLEDNVKFSGNNSIERLCNAINTLIDFLHEDLFLQRLLAWEISNDNYLTKRSTSKKEIFFSYSIEQYCDLPDHNTAEIKKQFSLIIGGVYYHFISRTANPAFDNSISSEKDIEELKKYTRNIISNLF